MTTTTAAVEHGITITEVHLPAGTPRRADCFCGWQSKLVASNPVALAEGEAHMIREATRNAREVRERIEAKAAAPETYSAKVADRIAETVRDGDPLTVDQIGVVAETIGCSASSLLPPHMSPIGDTVTAELLIWQTEPCPTWCDGAYHGNFDHPDDRLHIHELGGVDRTMSRAVSLVDGSYRLATVDVYVQQRELAADPYVLIHDNSDNDSTVKLTISEALNFRDILDTALDVARGYSTPTQTAEAGR